MKNSVADGKEGLKEHEETPRKPTESTNLGPYRLIETVPPTRKHACEISKLSAHMQVTLVHPGHHLGLLKGKQDLSLSIWRKSMMGM